MIFRPLFSCLLCLLSSELVSVHHGRSRCKERGTRIPATGYSTPAFNFTGIQLLEGVTCLKNNTVLDVCFYSCRHPALRKQAQTAKKGSLESPAADRSCLSCCTCQRSSRERDAVPMPHCGQWCVFVCFTCCLASDLTWDLDAN